MTQSRQRSGRGPLVVAWLVAAAGALNVLHAVLPGDDDGLLRSLTPDAVGPLARAAAVLTGIALLLAARGLARRRRRAWAVAVLVAALSTTLHVLHGLNDGTLASAVVLLALVARRNDFDGPGDAATRHLVVIRAATAAGVILGYGMAALWINRMVADQPFTPLFALREIAAGLFGLNIRGSHHLGGAFGELVPALAAAARRLRHRVARRRLARPVAAPGAAGSARPATRRRARLDLGRRHARAVRAAGRQVVLLRQREGARSSPTASSAASRSSRATRSAPRPSSTTLSTAFVAFAHRRDWRVAILGASEQRLELYRRHGLHALYHGDEAIVETSAFSLEGRAIRKVRQSNHRLEHAGFAARVLRPGELGDELRARAAGDRRHLARHAAGARLRDGAWTTCSRSATTRRCSSSASGPTGAPAAFCTSPSRARAARCRCRRCRALRTTPNGFNEWLICNAIAWAREAGYSRVSLNFAPFAALLTPEAQLSRSQEVQRRALLRLKGHFQLDNLLLFNRKFLPGWERRFVVYERRLDLPRVGIAALAAEAYLPFQSQHR